MTGRKPNAHQPVVRETCHGITIQEIIGNERKVTTNKGKFGWNRKTATRVNKAGFLKKYILYADCLEFILGKLKTPLCDKK